MEDYTDLSQSRKSGIWQHFLFNKTDENTKCKKCFAIIKASDSKSLMTHLKSLMTHLKSKHNIHVKSCMESTISEPKSKIPNICNYFKKDCESSGEVIAKLVAPNGFTFKFPKVF